jgi:hypothetical protein
MTQDAKVVETLTREQVEELRSYAEGEDTRDVFVQKRTLITLCDMALLSLEYSERLTKLEGAEHQRDTLLGTLQEALTYLNQFHGEIGRAEAMHIVSILSRPLFEPALAQPAHSACASTASSEAVQSTDAAARVGKDSAHPCELSDGTLEHDWEMRTDWDGDPGVINGTRTWQTPVCRRCGIERQEIEE